ncbi:MAG: TVP38/TMEM64 family protein [Clostridiales bacterium]|nr:TVP38/TMEM64 family protein [Clostridiales bacterium]
MEENNQEKHKKNIPIFFLVYILLTATCIVFSILTIHQSRVPFLQKNKTLFCVIASLLFVALCSFSVWFILSHKETLAKTAVSTFVFLLFCLVLIYVLQITGFFEIVKDEAAFQSYLEKSGGWMPIVYIVFQYLQVVLLPIPSVVSTLAGVALFGPLWTLLYSFIGIWLGSVTAFWVGRRLGYKAVAWMVGEETLQKWQKKLKRKDTFILTVMFFLPMFPDDLFCFISGLSTMKTRFFLIMITLSRIVSISATCFSLHLIPLNTWWGLLLWGVLIAIFLTAFILIYKNLDKIQDWFAKKFKKKKSDDEKEE